MMRTVMHDPQDSQHHQLYSAAAATSNTPEGLMFDRLMMPCGIIILIKLRQMLPHSVQCGAVHFSRSTLTTAFIPIDCIPTALIEARQVLDKPYDITTDKPYK